MKLSDSHTEHSPCTLAGEVLFDPVKWGRYVAARVYERHGSDLLRILAAWQWHLIISEEDSSGFPLPRFAVWDGDTNTIRLFRGPLNRAFSMQPQALALACAHEMFHGLAAHAYQKLLPSNLTPPLLSRAEEEIAAEAFARACSENFRLTFEA